MSVAAKWTPVLSIATDAAIAKGKVKTVAAVQGHQPIVYPVALVAASGKQALAQSFVDFVVSPAAQEIFSKFGFGKPQVSPGRP